MTITEFLSARLDEEEAVARTALARLQYGPTFPDLSLRSDGTVMINPGAVLAHVATRRALIEHCEPDLLTLSPGDDYVIRLLVEPYAVHIDYDPAWRVA